MQLPLVEEVEVFLVFGRLRAVCLGCVALAHLVADQALACGEWRLDVPVIKQTASFWISGTLVRPLDRPKARQVSAYTVAGNSLATMTAKLRGKVVRFDGRDLRVGEVALGRIDAVADGAALQIGAEHYRIQVVQVDPAGLPSPFRWQVSVDHEGEPWGSGRAMALCLGGPTAQKPDAGQLADERTDIVRRVALLALWATPEALRKARQRGPGKRG